MNEILLSAFFLYLIGYSVYSFNNPSNINSFSLGNKSFSTLALASTVTATWVSGSGFNINLSKFYSQGIIYAFSICGICGTLMLVSLYFVPKMQKFLHKVSIAQIMGEQYGDHARTLTAFCGVFLVGSGIYIQFKIMGLAINYIFPDLNEITCILISSSIVILYSSIGGINSVVQTDKIQASCFFAALLIGIGILYTKTNSSSSESSVPYHFQLSYITTLDNKTLLDSFLLFCYFLIPAFSPHVIQRIAMGVSIKQVKYSYFLASLGLGLIIIFSAIFAYYLYKLDPNIPNEKLFHSLLDVFDIPGSKALLIIAVVCMCMSTADSNINIAAVLIAHDFPYFKNLPSLQKLKIARYSSAFIGLLSIGFYLYQGELLHLILFAHNFYTPIITAPLIAIILGYNLSTRTFILSTISSASFILFCNFVIKTELNINTIALCVDILCLIVFHHVLDKWELLKPIGINSQLKDKK